MNEAVLNKLSEVNLATLVVIVILVVILLKFLDPIYDKIKNYIISKYKKDVKDKNNDDTLVDLKKRMSEYEENRVNDRKQSFKIQKELTDAISEIADKLNELCEITDKRFNESLERENKRVRAELKDRISQYYMMYHETGEWTLMQKEALEDLIEEYEAAGGKNSFVHSKVQLEMYTWKTIDKD